MVLQTKIDDTFPDSHILIEGFSKPFRLDRTAKGGGILLYMSEDIPCMRETATGFEPTTT